MKEHDVSEKRTSETPLIPYIEVKILSMRGHRVMLDADLAEMYGVTTFNLNKAVKRNIEELEKRIKTHDGEIALIFSAIHSMLHPATKKKRQIGFKSGSDA